MFIRFLVVAGEIPAAMKNDGTAKLTVAVNTTPKSPINNTCRISHMNLLSLILVIFVNVNHV